MNKAMARILIAGAFGLIALAGALTLEVTADGAPGWLIAVIASAAGYAFGQVQENGFNGKKHH